MNTPSPTGDGTAADEAHTTRWFDTSTIDECPWSDTAHARWVRRYWQPFVQLGAARFIRNVATTPLLLQIDEVFLPVTVNPGGEDTCYVCSPFAHYVTYAIEELRELKSPMSIGQTSRAARSTTRRAPTPRPRRPRRMRLACRPTTFPPARARPTAR